MVWIYDAHKSEKVIYRLENISVVIKLNWKTDSINHFSPQEKEREAAFIHCDFISQFKEVNMFTAPPLEEVGSHKFLGYWDGIPTLFLRIFSNITSLLLAFFAIFQNLFLNRCLIYRYQI